MAHHPRRDTFRHDGKHKVSNMNGPQVARQAAAHIQRNHAKPGRNFLGDRISPEGSAMLPAGGATPIDGGEGVPGVALHSEPDGDEGMFGGGY